MDANKTPLDFTELRSLLNTAAAILLELKKQASISNSAASTGGATGGAPGKADNPFASCVEIVQQFVTLRDMAKGAIAKSLSPGKASPDAPENAESAGALNKLLAQGIALKAALTQLASGLKQARDTLFKDGDKPADIVALMKEILQGKDFASAIAASLNADGPTNAPAAEGSPAITDSSAPGAPNALVNASPPAVPGSPEAQTASNKGLINKALSVLSKLGNFFASQGDGQEGTAAGSSAQAEAAGPGLSNSAATTGATGAPGTPGATGAPGLAASDIPQALVQFISQFMAPLGQSGVDSFGGANSFSTGNSGFSGDSLTSAMFIPPMPQGMSQGAPNVSAQIQYGSIETQGAGVSKDGVNALIQERLNFEMRRMVASRNPGVKQR